LDLYSKKDKSLPQKTMMITVELIIIALSYWVLFAGGYHRIFSAHPDQNGNGTRHLILFAFNIIVFARICFTFFYLIKRHIPWAEAFNIPVAFALYYIGFALLGYQSAAPFGGLDIIAIILFLTGSIINTLSELLRDRWKNNPGNKGHLYIGGLFKYAMHINYFGDFLWVTAYAVLTRNIYSVIIPAFLFCFFVFYNIPKLDNYLTGKYGDEFKAYRSGTKRFIPFIY
jgi:protein-S-isoprenylcysteine O-methyltransferase Ste14